MYRRSPSRLTAFVGEWRCVRHSTRRGLHVDPLSHTIQWDFSRKKSDSFARENCGGDSTRKEGDRCSTDVASSTWFLSSVLCDREDSSKDRFMAGHGSLRGDKAESENQSRKSNGDIDVHIFLFRCASWDIYLMWIRGLKWKAIVKRYIENW